MKAGFCGWFAVALGGGFYFANLELGEDGICQYEPPSRLELEIPALSRVMVLGHIAIGK